MIPEDLPKRAALNTQITTAELRNYTRTVNSLTQREKQCSPRSDLGLDRTRTTHCTLHLTQVVISEPGSPALKPKPAQTGCQQPVHVPRNKR